MLRRAVLFCLCIALTTPAIGQSTTNVGPTSVGGTVVISERLMHQFTAGTPGPAHVPNQSNWEPYTGVFGDGTLVAAMNTEADGDAAGATERAVVAFFNLDNSVVEDHGFFQNSDNQPWTANNDDARQNGNPPRVAPDKRAGGTRYVLGNESTPWSQPARFPGYSSGFAFDAQTGAVQLLDKVAGAATPVGPVIDPTYGTATTGAQGGQQIRFGGSIRALSNGNFAIVVEARSEVFRGAGNGRCACTTILDGQSGSGTEGQVIVGPFNADQGDVANDSTGIWSNMAAWRNGFAVRPEGGATQGGVNTIGFWDNNGTGQGVWLKTERTVFTDPLPPAGGLNTSIAANNGNGVRIDSDIRSDFVYLVGRGVDSAANPTGGVYVTKIDATNRTTVKEAFVSDGLIVTPDRVNVCVDANDNVFVQWSDQSNTGNRQHLGRLYDSNLDPLTDVFLLFENSEAGPTPTNNFAAFRPSCQMYASAPGTVRILITARVDGDIPAFGYIGNDHLAQVFEMNVPLPPSTIAFRTPSSVGFSTAMNEALMFQFTTGTGNTHVPNQSNWEPYTTAIGDGSLAAAVNTEADGDAAGATERAVVKFFNADNTPVEDNGFFDEANNPWTVNNDDARQNGNPPRIAGDKRDGATKYVLGNEATPWSQPALFPSFSAGFAYDAQVAVVQLLDRPAGVAAPVGRVLDPTHDGNTTGAQGGQQIRFGGEIRGLTDGNFVVMTEDRAGNVVAQPRCACTTIIDGNTGLRTLGPINACIPDPNASSEPWSNLAAWSGGFANRAAGCNDGGGNKVMNFYANDLTPQGTWSQIIRTNFADPLPPAAGNTTSIAGTGRGDGERIRSDIRSNFIYFAGNGVNALGNNQGAVYLTKIDANSRTTVEEVEVSAGLQLDPDRVDVASDANDNVCVVWAESSNTGVRQVAARLFDSNLDPITPAFLVFQNSELGPTPTTGFGAFHPNVSILQTSDGRIRGLVAARVDGDIPAFGYLGNDNIAIVFEEPAPTANVDNWEFYN